MVAYTTQLSGLEADGCRLRARSLLSRVLHGKRLVFRLEWPAALHAKLRASRWTPFPKPAHFHFLEGMAVPTSSQQLLCSSAYHAAISRPSQRVCFECGGPVKPGQLKSQGRKENLGSWSRFTAYDRSCSSPRPESNRCQSLNRVETRTQCRLLRSRSPRPTYA